MSLSSWRFLATRLHGDGTETLIAVDLPLTDRGITRAVSGPGGLSGTVPIEVARLVGQDGRPVLEPWACAVYAERDGLLVGAGLVTDKSLTMQGPTLALSTRGFSSYLEGMPYEGNSSWVDEDPANLVRHAWGHVQGFAGGNLGMVVDSTATPERVGEPEEDVEFTTEEGEEVEFTAGPYRWNYWSTHDLGAEVDKLAQNTPLDYIESHSWNGEQVDHRLRLGYPRVGRRRSDLRFVVGENVIEEPSVGVGLWASEVTVLGAGEGRKMRSGRASVDRNGRLRRPAVVVDKSLQSNRACNQEASFEIAWRTGANETSTITVMDHPSAPIGSWTPGDEILLQGSGQGWNADLYQWVRILSDVIKVDTDRAVLTIASSGRTS